MDVQDSPQKEEQSPVTSPLPRCPECGERHVERSQIPPGMGAGWRATWYCIDCCFSWFR